MRHLVSIDIVKTYKVWVDGDAEEAMTAANEMPSTQIEEEGSMIQCTTVATDILDSEDGEES